MLFSHNGGGVSVRVYGTDADGGAGAWNDANVLKWSKELLGLTEGCLAAIDD